MLELKKLCFITLCFSAPFMHSTPTLLGNLENDIEIAVSDIEKDIDKVLPDDIKNGKTVIFSMPDCKEPTWVKVSFPGVKAKRKEQKGNNWDLKSIDWQNLIANQKFIFTATNHIKSIAIPKIAKRVFIEIRPAKDVAAYKKAMIPIDQAAKNNKKVTPLEEKAFNQAMEKYEKAPTNFLTLHNKNLSNNQIIKLPYPAMDKPTVNSTNDHILANMDGEIFKNLPEHIKKSGKQITITVPNCGHSIRAQVEQTIKDRSDLGLVSQILIFTPKKQAHTIYIPEPRNENSKISIRLRPNEIVARYNVFMKKHAHWLHALTPKEDQELKSLTDELFEKTPTSYQRYRYSALQDGQHIQLQCPTQTLNDKLKEMGHTLGTATK